MSSIRTAAALTTACLVFASSWVGAEPPTTFPVRITPSRSVVLELDLTLGQPTKKPEKAKIEGERKIRKTIIPATVTEDVRAQGCLILRQGAAAEVEILDASAPMKKGIPGFVQLKLTAIEFVDGKLREWEGGSHCVVGDDLTDKGKKLKVLPRKGGPAVLQATDDPIEFSLLEGEPPEPSCGVGAEAEEEDKEETEEKPRPHKLILIPAELCNRRG